MKFNFFTFGGSQFWEDVFFYQKWRIQRHYRSKKYRLLDNWDIQRATGGFEDCRKAFVRYIEAYEIPRQSGELIVLLHGLGESKNIFKPLWRYLTDKGYIVAAINYPSTRKPLRHLMRQLEFFLTHCEDANKVSFITNGSGCLLLRSVISSTYGWQDKFRLNKVININPINCGSDTYDLMSRFKIFNMIFGPMLKESAPYNAKSISKIPPDVDLGLIFCETLGKRLIASALERFNGMSIKNEVTERNFSDKKITIKCNKRKIFNNEEVLVACENFIANGEF